MLKRYKFYYKKLTIKMIGGFQQLYNWIFKFSVYDCDTSIYKFNVVKLVTLARIKVLPSTIRLVSSNLERPKADDVKAFS